MNLWYEHWWPRTLRGYILSRRLRVRIPDATNGGLLRVMVDTFLPAWYGTYGNLLSYERFVTSRSGSLSVTTSFVDPGPFCIKGLLQNEGRVKSAKNPRASFFNKDLSNDTTLRAVNTTNITAIFGVCLSTVFTYLFLYSLLHFTLYTVSLYAYILWAPLKESLFCVSFSIKILRIRKDSLFFITGSDGSARLVIGHNVSYDRIRVGDEYSMDVHGTR
jgi:hypothetical protein